MGKSRSSAETARHRAHTRLNKIKAIKKALLIAKGSGIAQLEARLKFWEEQKI